MQEALLEAKAAAQNGEVPVGALVVDPVSGEIVARKGNGPIGLTDPTAHAEILVLKEAARKIGNYRLSGLTLYVTLEPCTMCAGAISNARISRVVFGAEDIKGGAVVNGVRFFESASCHHRPECTSGILADECGDILRGFFKARRK